MIAARRVAALYDIHGNLPALEAALKEIEARNFDLVVVGGDVVPGPMPRETLQRLLRLDRPVQFIQGNGEIAVLDEIAGKVPQVPATVRENIQWTGRALTLEQLDLLGHWPKTLSIDISGIGPVLFCHATPRDANEVFTKRSPEDRIREIFDSVETGTVICGHTHMQFERIVGPLRIVNAGSVGMPFGEPGAFWLEISHEITFHRTPYNLEAAAADIRLTKYPEAGSFAENYVLSRPSSEQMLQAFDKVG